MWTKRGINHRNLSGFLICLYEQFVAVCRTVCLLMATCILIWSDRFLWFLCWIFFGDTNAWAMLDYFDLVLPLIWCLDWYYYASFLHFGDSKQITKSWTCGLFGLNFFYSVLKWIWTLHHLMAWNWPLLANDFLISFLIYLTFFRLLQPASFALVIFSCDHLRHSWSDLNFQEWWNKSAKIRLNCCMVLDFFSAEKFWWTLCSLRIYCM